MRSQLQLQSARGSVFHSTQSFLQPPASAIKLRRRAKTTIRERSAHSDPTRKSVKDIEDEITVNYQQILRIISQLEDVLDEKLETHEMELLKVFKFTVEKITIETQQIVEHFNKAIEEVKLSTRMADLQNELDFFRSESLELFEQNKIFREEIKKLKATIESVRIENELKDGTVLSLAKKLCKLRIRQNKDPQNQKLSLLTEPNMQTASKPWTGHARSTVASKNTRYKSVSNYRQTETSWMNNTLKR